MFCKKSTICLIVLSKSSFCPEITYCLIEKKTFILYIFFYKAFVRFIMLRIKSKVIFLSLIILQVCVYAKDIDYRQVVFGNAYENIVEVDVNDFFTKFPTAINNKTAIRSNTRIDSGFLLAFAYKLFTDFCYFLFFLRIDELLYFLRSVNHMAGKFLAGERLNQRIRSGL